MTEPAHLTLSPETTDAFLAKMGLSGRPDTDLDGLTTLYGAWLQSVPFCSTLKRYHYRDDPERPGPLPIATAPAFAAEYLAHGTGGTCFPTAESWFQLLIACGFEATRGAGAMLDFPQIPGPNHGTVTVELDGRLYLVDPFFGSRAPLRLDDAPQKIAALPSLELRTEPDSDNQHGGRPIVFWQFYNTRSAKFRFGFDPRYLTTDQAFFAERYEASSGPNSVFNRCLYISRHRGDEVHTIYQGTYFILKPDNSIADRPVGEDRTELLTGVFGISEERALGLPADIDDG